MQMSGIGRTAEKIIVQQLAKVYESIPAVVNRQDTQHLHSQTSSALHGLLGKCACHTTAENKHLELVGIMYS